MVCILTKQYRQKSTNYKYLGTAVQCVDHILGANDEPFQLLDTVLRKNAYLTEEKIKLIVKVGRLVLYFDYGLHAYIYIYISVVVQDCAFPLNLNMLNYRLIKLN